MKKVFSIIAIAAASAVFVACGPSKEELEAKAKMTADSIAKADSMANAAAAEELAKQQAMADSAAKVQAAADSARIADSLANAKGPKKGKK
jgi:hypothetical protein